MDSKETQLELEQFAPERTIEDVPGVGTVYIGSDLRLYRKTNGLMTLIAPCEPVKDSEPKVWVTSVDWTEFPPLSQVKYLFTHFLSKFKREVMVLIGRRWDNDGWFFMVPKQVGSVASVEWKDPEGTDWFLQFGRYIGTVHVHPGNSATPSNVDENWWSERDASGLHAIVGRDGCYTISGSCVGHVVPLLQGTLAECSEEKAVLFTSRNKPLQQILRVKKIAKVIERKQLWEPTQQSWTGRPLATLAWRAGGLWVSSEETEGLRVLLGADGECVIVTAQQMVEIARDLEELGQEVPVSVPLTTFATMLKRGGTNGLYVG